MDVGDRRPMQMLVHRGDIVMIVACYFHARKDEFFAFPMLNSTVLYR